jgi:hypothetical protein
MKGNATADTILVDKSRGNNYTVDACVRVHGTIKVDHNGTMKKRLDRFKLFAQAIVNLTRKGVEINKALVMGEMDRLWMVHKENRDLKQIDSETFDSVLAELFGQGFYDRMYAAVDENAVKAGDFSVSDLTIDILTSRVGAVGADNMAVWEAPASASPVSAMQHVAGGSPNEADTVKRKPVRRKK